MKKVFGSAIIAASLASTAFAGVFYCCKNECMWDGVDYGSCSGSTHTVCDKDPYIVSCPSNLFKPGNYRPRGCTKYSGQFAAGPCNQPPDGRAWIAIPGFPGTGCCWFLGSRLFTQDGSNTIITCSGTCACQ
jgi:hypothetical protein